MVSLIIALALSMIIILIISTVFGLINNQYAAVSLKLQQQNKMMLIDTILSKNIYASGSTLNMFDMTKESDYNITNWQGSSTLLSQNPPRVLTVNKQEAELMVSDIDLKLDSDALFITSTDPYSNAYIYDTTQSLTTGETTIQVGDLDVLAGDYIYIENRSKVAIVKATTNKQTDGFVDIDTPLIFDISAPLYISNNYTIRVIFIADNNTLYEDLPLTNRHEQPMVDNVSEFKIYYYFNDQWVRANTLQANVLWRSMVHGIKFSIVADGVAQDFIYPLK